MVRAGNFVASSEARKEPELGLGRCMARTCLQTIIVWPGRDGRRYVCVDEGCEETTAADLTLRPSLPPTHPPLQETDAGKLKVKARRQIDTSSFAKLGVACVAGFGGVASVRNV